MSMSYLARDIASRLHNRGSYICPKHSDVVADLQEIAAADLVALKQSFDARKLEILSAYGYNDPPPQTKPFAFSNGMAIIPVHGMLINRLSWASSYATGYNFIQAQTQAALADPDVKGIVYDVNSSGGIAAGCGELAKEIFASRDQKPSLTVVDSKAYSAAYYLGSAASRMVVTPSGGVGSIGVVAMHVDYSGMLDDAGIKLTMIHAGAEKVDGNPFQQLSARARANIQRDVDYHYGMFTEAVAQHRDMPVDDVRATEAATYLPPEALDVGLVDAVEMPADAIADFNDRIAKGAGSVSMAGTASAAGAREPESGSKTGAIDMDEAQVQTLVTTAVASALSAERVRQSGIRTCDEAKGREKLADHLANNTEMTVDAAKAILAVAPKEVEKSAGSGASPFASAMAGTANPNLNPDGSGDGAGAEADTPEVRAGRLLGAYGRATGKVIDLKAGIAA